MPKLIIETPDEDPIAHDLVGPVTLGRSAEADITVLDRKMSREHCGFQSHLGMWQVQDLDSSNGTRVNGVVCKKRMLENGDRIAVGTTKIRYETEEVRKKAPVLQRRESARDRLKSRRKRG